MFCRHINNTLRTPLGEQSSMQGGNGYSRDRCPLTEQQGLTVGPQRSAVASIAALFATGRPLYIARLVVPVYVNTINRVIRRRSDPNTAKKLLKGCKAEFDAAPSVVVVRNIRWAITSMASGIISIVLNAVSHPVLSVTRYAHIILEASARFGVSIIQQGGNYFSAIAAVTFAQPHIVRTSCAQMSEHGQSSKAFVSEVFEVVGKDAGGRCDRIVFRHKFLLNRNLCSGSHELFAQFGGPFLLYQKYA